MATDDERGDDGLKHGSPSTYRRYGCRCDDCRAAWSRYNGLLRRTRRLNGRTCERAGCDDPHWQRGLCLRCYGNWTCRNKPDLDEFKKTFPTNRRARTRPDTVTRDHPGESLAELAARGEMVPKDFPKPPGWRLRD